MAAGIPVKLRVNVKSRYLDDKNAYNVLAELPGSDPKLKDEIVMLGAHLDSLAHRRRAPPTTLTARRSRSKPCAS